MPKKPSQSAKKTSKKKTSTAPTPTKKKPRPSKAVTHYHKSETAKRKLPPKELTPKAPEPKLKLDRFEKMVARHLLPYGSPLQSLLFPKESLPLPPRNTTTCQLFTMIRDQPERYQRWLGCIMLGASLDSSAARFGIHPHTFRLWRRIGCEDLRDEKDTYYSRLILDLRNAVAFAASSAEHEVKKSNPLTYLRNGAGRIFGDWSKHSNKSPLINATDDPSDPNFNPSLIQEAFNQESEDRLLPLPSPVKETPLSEEEGEGYDGDFQGTFPSAAIFLDALTELESLNLITVDPALLKAAREQLSDAATEDYDSPDSPSSLDGEVDHE